MSGGLLDVVFRPDTAPLLIPESAEPVTIEGQRESSSACAGLLGVCIGALDSPCRDVLRIALHEPAEQGGHKGVFLGTDERFGMLIRDDDQTHLVPMSALLGGNP